MGFPVFAEQGMLSNWNSLNLIRLLMLVTLIVGLPAGAVAAEASYDKVFSNRNATGEDLAYAFFDLLSHTGSPDDTVGTTPEQDEASKALVKPYLDPAFLLQRASGQRYTADTYVPADVDAFEIGDIRETRPSDDVVVVRYSVRTDQTLPDAALVMSDAKAPRLTVFHWSDADSRWKILSHANFNTPVAAICKREPLIDNQLVSPASAADQALGQSIAEQWFALAEAGDLLQMASPMVQLQTAGGQGYTTIREHQQARISKTEMDRLVITRNDKLLVVSLYARVSDTLLLGEQFGTDFTPRLYTFMAYPNGAWRLISSAYFNVPKALPQGVACVASGKLENAP